MPAVSNPLDNRHGNNYYSNCNCNGCNCICIDTRGCNCDFCKGGGNCGPEACIVLLVIMIIIAIIIIFSAIIVLIGYAAKKLSDYAMIYNDMTQQCILEQNGVIEICDRDDPPINRYTNANPDTMRQNYRANDQMV